MTEQPVKEPGDETAEPTRAWAPVADDVTETREPEAAADPGPVEAVETGEPSASPAEPSEPPAQPSDTIVPPPVVEPTAVSAPETPSPWLAQPSAEPEPTALEVTAPTAPLGFPETVALPVEAPAQTIFRDSPTEAIPDPYADPLSEEAQKLAAERAARKEARDAALAAVAPPPVVAPEPVVIKERTNDRFLGSVGIFLLRLVVAGIFGIRGYQMLGDLAATQERFAQTLLAPYAQILAIVTGAAHLLIALALILGLLTRIAGLGVVLVAGGALAFVWWGPWSPFVAGQAGFLGELELLLAAVGLLLLLIGGGGWSIDRSFRSARARDKAARQLAPH